jgi:hypothetical protein
MKTAKEIFGLTVYNICQGVADVGDGAERFNVVESALEDMFDENITENELRKEYDFWCVRSSDFN